MAAAFGLQLAWIPGFATWLVVWLALAAATIVLIVLLRTRWRETKAWKKCALLSLWVHVLLACLAANVRIGLGGSGAGIGPGTGGPIRVAIVSLPPTAVAPQMEMPVVVEDEPASESDDAEVATRVPTPVGELPAAAELSADEHEAPAEPEPMLAPPPDRASPPADAIVLANRDVKPELPTPDATLLPPDLLPEPEPEPVPEPQVEPESEADEEQVADAEPAVDEAKTQANADSGAALKVADVGVASDAVAPTPALSAVPQEQVAIGNRVAAPEGANVEPKAASRNGVPAPYANRFVDRAAMVSGGGGDPTTEKAVRAALAWLAANQEREGRWDPVRHGAGQERYVLGEDRRGAGAKADTGITALALLAFMGAGHTHREGPYAATIAHGLDYLRRSQAANGNLGGQAEMFAHMYCHSMATFAVSEACALTGDERLRPIVQRAVAYSLAAQHPSDGGWRYRPGDTGDTSQLGWQLMALRSAELAGVAVPATTWPRVKGYLSNVERGVAGGLAAYRPEGPPSRAMTAEALFCRQLLTHRGDGALTAPAFDEASRALLEEKPGGVAVNLYYWYYATIALHRAQHETPAATEAWDEWNQALTRTLVGSQSNDGSWTTACLWGGYGGRVYTTSLAAMCLEVYYRYAPEAEAAPNVAQRTDWQSTPQR